MLNNAESIRSQSSGVSFCTLPTDALTFHAVIVQTSTLPRVLHSLRHPAKDAVSFARSSSLRSFEYH